MSRLPVINKSSKLVGILTRYDLRVALAQPKNSQSFLSRKGEKHKFINKPIRGYFKRSVITATEKQTTSQMIQQMLSQNIGSIIIVNVKWQPVDIFSFTDLLKAIAQKGKERKIKMLTSFSESFFQKDQFEKMLGNLQDKLQQRSEITRIEANLKTQKNRAEKNRRYKVNLLASANGKKTFSAESSDFKWKKALQIAIGRLEKQIRRH